MNDDRLSQTDIKRKYPSMLIGVKKRFLFIANSKSASTSIEHALINHTEIERGSTPQRKHITLCEALEEYDFLFSQPAYHPDTFFKFGVFRDPVDWIYSWFRYRKRKNALNALPVDMPFSEFWNKNDWNKWRQPGRPRLQRDMFADADGKIIADYLIPHQQVSQHFSKILKNLGLKDTLPARNVSAISGSPTDLSEDMLAELRAFYAADYAVLENIDEINRAGLERFGWA